MASQPTAAGILTRLASRPSDNHMPLQDQKTGQEINPKETKTAYYPLRCTTTSSLLFLLAVLGVWLDCNSNVCQIIN